MSLETALGGRWASLRAARERTEKLLQDLDDSLSGLAPEDTSLVVFGSLARGEVTEDSDVDWTLLVDGLASPHHFDAYLDIEEALRNREDKGPGREGTFGGLAFSHDILHRIGGGEDTNKNTTQRILLLLESAAIGPEDSYRRVIRNVLARYIGEDYGWMHKQVSVPRFLQNDIARYWRTVAVDFAYKRRQRRGSGWALRTVKLRLSRKLTYASGLLTCFSPELESLATPDEAEIADHDLTLAVIEHLSNAVRHPPLERMAMALGPHAGLHGACSRIFSSYDAFIGLLDDRESRDRLEDLSPAEAERDPVYQRAREIGHDFQGGLDEIFFGDNGTRIPELTRKYGVF